ncbi:MAG: hypothetical protein NDJ89_19125 [Oligoflexia bacterium]|nr:hypothetical protein [Oligoflexia bacterium]
MTELSRRAFFSRWKELALERLRSPEAPAAARAETASAWIALGPVHRFRLGPWIQDPVSGIEVQALSEGLRARLHGVARPLKLDGRGRLWADSASEWPAHAVLSLMTGEQISVTEEIPEIHKKEPETRDRSE